MHVIYSSALFIIREDMVLEASLGHTVPMYL